MGQTNYRSIILFDKTLHKTFFTAHLWAVKPLQRTKVCDIMHTTTMRVVVEYPSG